MREKTKLTIDARSMQVSPQLIPQKVAEFAAAFMIPNAAATYDPETQTVIMTCDNDMADARANREAIIMLAAETRGWIMR